MKDSTEVFEGKTLLHCFLRFKKKLWLSYTCDTFNCIGENKSSKCSTWLSKEFLMEADFI